MPQRSGAALREDLFQFERNGRNECVEGALPWWFVGAPSLEGGRVAEAVALEVVEGEFADEFGPEADPTGVLASGPAAGRPWRAATSEPEGLVFGHEGGEFVDESALFDGLEAGRVADGGGE